MLSQTEHLIDRCDAISTTISATPVVTAISATISATAATPLATALAAAAAFTVLLVAMVKRVQLLPELGLLSTAQLRKDSLYWIQALLADLASVLSAARGTLRPCKGKVADAVDLVLVVHPPLHK